MGKYVRLRARLLACGEFAEDDFRIPEVAADTEITRAHCPGYLGRVVRGELDASEVRAIGFPWSDRMVERSRRSAGATLAAAREALTRGWSANLAGGTHHAHRDRGEGFCVFNDVAIAALVLLRDRSIERAVVVDCDVHQGNGTASIFRDDPRVFTLSFHGERNFPFRKEASDRDVAFADGAGDDEYLRALERHVPEVLDAHQPDVVFYLAGADPYEGDRLGRLKLTIDGLRARDRLVFDACRERGLPVAITMSGGYCPDVDAIVTIHTNTIREAVHSCRSVFAC